jgi:methylated-DNA-[protein]-cysteine S-methyltransferase
MKGPFVRVHTVVDSPVGALALVALDGTLAGLYMDLQRHRPPAEMFGDSDPRPFTEVIRQLDEYFAGQRTAFDLPMNLVGTPFQRAVWSALRQIPYGETWSYGQLAERIGRPGAARAVGLANGRNPIGIIVPCHRVVGSTGDLTGYGGGLERKRHLLDFECQRQGSVRPDCLFEVATFVRTPTDPDRGSPQNGGMSSRGSGSGGSGSGGGSGSAGSGSGGGSVQISELSQSVSAGIGGGAGSAWRVRGLGSDSRIGGGGLW